MFYVQRSTDGHVLYIRKAPNKRWEAKIDQIHGSAYLFEDIAPGTGGWYFFEPVVSPTQIKNIDVTEVSLVAKAPHGKRFLLKGDRS